MSEPRLTRGQAAIIGAYTGFAAGPFGDVHEYAERILGRPIWTHEFADQGLVKRLRDAARADFLAICVEVEERGSEFEDARRKNEALGAVAGVNYYPGVECKHGYDFCPLCDSHAPRTEEEQGEREFIEDCVALVKRVFNGPHDHVDAIYLATKIIQETRLRSLQESEDRE